MTRFCLRAMLVWLLTVGAVVLGANQAVLAFTRGSSALDPRRLESCVNWLARGLGSEATCVRGRLERMMRHSPGAALLHAQQATGTSEYLQVKCHILMHRHGREQVLDVAKVSRMEGQCADGFLHGTLERLVAEGGAVRDILLACYSDEVVFASMSCEHGLGHSFMRREGNDLPAALRGCMELGGKAARNCAGGAFMENDFAASDTDQAGQTKWFRASDPDFMCSAVRTFSDTCAAWAVRLVREDGRLAYCTRAPIADRGPCLYAVGVLTAPQAKRTGRVCRDNARCWTGAAFAATNRVLTVPGLDARELAQYCAAAPGRAASGCGRGVGLAVWIFTPLVERHSTLRTVCEKLSGTAAAQCAQKPRASSLVVDFM